MHNVVDTIPPEIENCPTFLTDTVELGITGTTVIWTEPTATDASGIPMLSNRTHSPGDFFSVGVTTVIYTFSDTSQNMAMCTFTVFIQTGKMAPYKV